MSNSKELKILKSAEKQLQNPNANRNLNLTAIVLIVVSFIFLFILFVLRKQGIVSEGVALSLAGGSGALFGIAIFLKILCSRSYYIEKHISLKSMRDRINELET